MAQRWTTPEEMFFSTLRTTWREASRLTRLALDTAYLVHAALTADPVSIDDGWHLVDSDPASETDDDASTDVDMDRWHDDNGGLFDDEPLAGGYTFPESDSDSDSDLDAAWGDDDDEVSSEEGEVISGEFSDDDEPSSGEGNSNGNFDSGVGLDDESEIYQDAHREFEDPSDDGQPSRPKGRTQPVPPTQPGRRGSDLCASMEQSQTLEVDGGRDGRRTSRETTAAKEGGLAGVLDRGEAKEQPERRRGEGRVPDEAPSAPVATTTRPLRREDFGFHAMSQAKYTKLYLEAKELRRRVAAAAERAAAAGADALDDRPRAKIPKVRRGSRTEAGPASGGAPGERIPPDPRGAAASKKSTPPTTGASTERPQGTPPVESPYQRLMRRQAQAATGTGESGYPAVHTESFVGPDGMQYHMSRFV
ncbi:hypothetical protein C8A01DRAFT_35309 [Parachaetomium inaequale]|uniref:Uncharacterized protein n=1 Tax=Parachaetomium inaequale TaxID=2588326 RepID=A0AAN6SSP0_9PEZI|nr:hypothetical protein C8A01DRAFT_35309 [Parachaetomium inaequale]